MESILQELREQASQKQTDEGFDRLVYLSELLSDTMTRLKNSEQNINQLNEKLGQLGTAGYVPEDEGDIQVLNSTLLELYDKKDLQQSQKEKLQHEKEVLSGNIRKCLSEIDQIKKDEQKYTEQTAILQQQRNSLEENLATITNDMKKCQDDWDSISVRYNKIQTEIPVYKKQIQEKQAKIKQYESVARCRPLNKFYTEFKPHKSAINAVTFFPHYQSFITAGDDKRIIHWGLPNMNEISSIVLPSNQLGISIQKDGRLLACSGMDKAVRILDLQSFRVVSELKNHTAACTESIWISNSNLLSASKDRTVKIFDLNKNTVSFTVMAISAVNSICVTDQPHIFVAACQDKHLRVIDTRDKKVQMKIDAVHTMQPTSIIYDETNHSLWSVGLDKQLCQTSLKEAKKITQRTHPKLEIKNLQTKINMQQDIGLICVGSEGGRVFLFNSRGNEEPMILEGHHEGAVLNSTFAANTRLTVDSKGNCVFWT